jgi:hypothetical protein
VDDDLMLVAYPILMRAYQDHICDLTRPYPGVQDAFDALAAQGTALALCTNKPERPAVDLLKALGWQDRFAAVVAGDTLAVSKPDPARCVLRSNAPAVVRLLSLAIPLLMSRPPWRRRYLVSSSVSDSPTVPPKSSARMR